MNYLVIAHIHTDMGSKTAVTAGIGEDHQIDTLQILFGHDDAIVQLLDDRAVDRSTHLIKHILRISGAVKTIRTCAPVHIRNANVLLCHIEQRTAQIQRLLHAVGLQILCLRGIYYAVYIIFSGFIDRNLAFGDIAIHIIAIHFIEIAAGAQHIQLGAVLEATDLCRAVAGTAVYLAGAQAIRCRLRILYGRTRACGNQIGIKKRACSSQCTDRTCHHRQGYSTHQKTRYVSSETLEIQNESFLSGYALISNSYNPVTDYNMLITICQERKHRKTGLFC